MKILTPELLVSLNFTGADLREGGSRGHLPTQEMTEKEEQTREKGNALKKAS